MFVEEVVRRAREAEYSICNVDVTIVLQRPKLGRIKPEIIASLASVLGCKASRVNIKAKTREGVDAVGEGRGDRVLGGGAAGGDRSDQ